MENKAKFFVQNNTKPGWENTNNSHFIFRSCLLFWCGVLFCLDGKEKRETPLVWRVHWKGCPILSGGQSISVCFFYGKDQHGHHCIRVAGRWGPNKDYFLFLLKQLCLRRKIQKIISLLLCTYLFTRRDSQHNGDEVWCDFVWSPTHTHTHPPGLK